MIPGEVVTGGIFIDKKRFRMVRDLSQEKESLFDFCRCTFNGLLDMGSPSKTQRREKEEEVLVLGKIICISSFSKCHYSRIFIQYVLAV
jgi:hypothetical protein